MFKSYILLAIRNLRKQRAFSFINIAGLAVAVAAVLLIFEVIHYETSYDSWQSRADRIYRVVTSYKKHSNGEPIDYQAAVPLPMAPALRSDFPQLEKVAAVYNITSAQIHVPGPKGLEDEKLFREEDGLFWAESSFFDIMDYHWIEGNASGLQEPHTAVLNQRLAEKYFGSAQQAMGRMIQLWSFRVPLKVVGVFRNLPENTDVEIKMAGSIATLDEINNHRIFSAEQWGKTLWASECFVLARNARDIQSVQARMGAFAKKYYPADQMNGPIDFTLSFEPLKEMHLNEKFYTWKGDALTHKELWSLALIGVFLLLVACINFINLATAQSVNRAKEIGVRKVLGSQRTDLLWQFLGETALITCCSLILGVLLAELSLPALSVLMKKPLSLDLLHQPMLLLFLLGIGVVVTLLSGLYPGWVMGRFRPIEAIKNKISAKTVGGISLRRGLVVFQFVIAQLLVIGTVVVIRQMQFFRNQNMGFQQKAVAMVELPSDSLDATKYRYLRQQFLQVPGVSAASLCMDAPASWGSAVGPIYFDHSVKEAGFTVQRQWADTNYLSTFQIQLAAGRLPAASDSTQEMVVNEMLVKNLGFSSDQAILGKTMSFDPKDPQRTIVGVIKDYNSKSLREGVQPLVLQYSSVIYNYLAFRMDGDQMSRALEQVHSIFTKTYPYYYYDLTFLDERIESFYHAEQLITQLFKVFAVLAIFISCLGLYGLVSFMAVQKTKEVGIRKVLGASVQSIVLLFSREFTMLVGVAFLIAAPLGYYFMHHWLNDFHYHIQLGWGIFAIAIFASILIAWLTVGYKALRAALANPVKSLRSE